MSKTPIHIMVDTETLSLKPTAAVIDIAAAVVGDVSTSFQCYIHPDHYLLVPENAVRFHVDQGTMAWHKSGKSKSYPAAEVAGISPYDAAKHFHDWLRALQTTRSLYLWANGSNFDFPILTHLLNTVGVDVPWAYNCVRDLRTLVKVCETEKPAGADHSALGDCIAQAQWLQDCVAKYGLKLG